MKKLKLIAQSILIGALFSFRHWWVHGPQAEWEGFKEYIEMKRTERKLERLNK